MGVLKKGLAYRVGLGIFSIIAILMVAVLAVYLYVQAHQESVEQWLNAMVIFLFLGLLLSAAIIVRFVHRSVLQPILLVEDSVRRISQGELTVIDAKDRLDELGKLIEGINHMVHSLERREYELANQREELETQNQEITAQQEEQLIMVEKLIQSEFEMAMITSFQEKLTGAYDKLDAFLQQAISGLLQVTGQDAALLLIKEEETYKVIYSVGYPHNLYPRTEELLYGLAQRVWKEHQILTKVRPLTAKERGLHDAHEKALDQYYPLYYDNSDVFGTLLLTSYHFTEISETQSRLISGLLKQFELALTAQMANEVRREQSIRLEEMNLKLLQEKKQIEEQRDITESILESSHEAIVKCDMEGVIIFTNQRMKEFFGFGTIVGQGISMICRESQISSDDRLYEKIDSFIRGDIFDLQERFSHTNSMQQKQSFELYGNLVSGKLNREKRGYLFVFRNRTEEEKVDEMKNEFISIVSHELRTPLSSILGFMEILLYRNLNPEKQKKYMNTVYEESKRLSKLINDFLDLQRIESGHQEYHFSPIDLVKLCRETVEQWQGQQDHKIRLHLPNAECLIKADRDRIKQVLHNLLSNAMKYSPGKDIVDLHILRENGNIVVSVQDYGLGIPEEAKEKLFSKFYRVDNSDRRKIGGTGLGLAIAKEIVEIHNGQLAFSSQLGEGTTFTMIMKEYRLPALDGKIVILEDDENLIKLIRAGIEKLNQPMSFMTSAEEAIMALHRVEQDSPLLFIVDIQLDGMQSGWDFISELNSHPAYSHIPVIVTTVLDPPKNYRDKVPEEYLQKPFSIERLTEVVRQILSNQMNNTSFIFPYQDEQFLTNSLKEKGMEVEKVKVKQDVIEVELKKTI